MKSLRKNCAVFVILSVFALVPAIAQESDDAIALPEARVSAEKETSQFITQEQMERRGDTDLWQAMRWVPGVFVTNGGQRNEADFKLRGFSTKDVPVYLDGIPWGDHYNAQVDYSGFLIGDLESIQINKGYSSVLLGSGNLGGAVIMRTAKPKEKLEIGVKTSWNFDKEGYGGNTETATIGTKQNLFYAKTTFQWRDVDHWSLPDSFQATDGSPQQTGKRYASDSSTMKISGIAGFTPSEAWDIYATYSYSQSARGLSPISVGSSFAVWEWPYADRHSASLNAELELDRFYVKAKGFFDKFDNRLYIYNSEKGGPANLNNYLNGTKPSASDYDDYVAGGNLEGGFTINDWNKIAASVQYKQTSHKSYDSDDHNDASQEVHVSDNNIFAGVEYTLSPVKPLTFIAGLCVDTFIAGDAKFRNNPLTDYKKTDVKVGGQLGAFYDITNDHELYFSWALKNRFPTLKEKFQKQDATGGNRYVPNPDLKAENVHHFELGYKGYFLEKINVNVATFYSWAADKINTVTTIKGATADDPNYRQYQNIDEMSFYGLELGTEMYLNKFFILGSATGLTKYDIKKSGTDVKYIENLPELTTNVYIVIKPFENVNLKQVKNISIIPSFEYVGSRDTGEGENGIHIARAGYSLAHIKASVDITKYASFSFTVNNLFDELYESATGYPQAGRSFNLTLIGKY